ncbi:MAG: YCF48-related protein [Planctomycetaceae bacterium]
MEGRWVCLLIMVSWCGAAWSAPPIDLERTWRDDAALYDVQFVDSKHGWAVGEHGAVWQTSDGGRQWSLRDAGTTATLRSVCLLTDQVGWIAGWQTHGSRALAEGMLLATKDGGQSWQSLDVSKLSPLKSVRFFGLDEGVLIGEPTEENPTGVWNTTDGGQNWQPLGGRASSGWNCTAIVAPEMGLLAGRDGGVALLAGPQLLPSRMPPLQGRAVRALALVADAPSWLVGDGGLVMRSESEGVVWEALSEGLPNEVRFVSDFRAVAAHGQSVWIAGNPGGVIWHSRDGGRNWTRQLTGCPIPINQLRFVTPQHGCAVGELGVIHVTSDGGSTWTTNRGSARHAALLSIHARLRDVTPETMARISGDLGFRSVSWLPIHPSESPGQLNLAERLQEAASRTGGASAAADWQLPLETPGLEHDAEKLLESWRIRTENKLPQVLLGQLVRQLRVWRPHVVLIDQPAKDDAAGQLLLDATLKAIEQAEDSTRFISQRDLGGLKPWAVDRIYLRLPPGSNGEIAIDPFDVLPRWKSAVRIAATESRALLDDEPKPAERIAYRAIDKSGQPFPESGGSDFFAGLKLSPSGDIRRDVLPVSTDDRRLDQVLKAAQRQRNISAYVERSLADPRVAGQMIAQLKDVTTGMAAEQAAATLWELAGDYRRSGQLDLADAVCVELTGRFPDQPLSAEAARWMLHYLVSEEVTWQRIRTAREDDQPQAKPLKPLPGQPIRQTSYETRGANLDELKERYPRAQRLVRQFEERWPKLAGASEVQFPLAALNRSHANQQQAENIFRVRYKDPEHGARGVWDDVVRREVWLAHQETDFPEGISRCFMTSAKPVLDGMLSDECWQRADEMLLTTRSPATMPGSESPMVLMARDSEYLYLAASVPRLDGLPADLPQTKNRTHDADLRKYDRLTIRLDVDRDYATWYEFQIDQRGWTAETCWEDPRWNPSWFVAVEGDAAQWSVEIAIPWSVLVAKVPGTGTAWGVSLERTAPAIGRQSWTQPATERSPGTSLGLLRFE